MDRLARLFVEAHLDALGEGLAGRAHLRHPGVVALDVAHAELRHQAIARLHLRHRPLQRGHGLLRVRHDGRQKVGDPLVDREFQHLRIDHDEANALGRMAVEERQDHRVDPDRLARSRGARDQQVGHAGEVHHRRLAADVLAEHERQLRLRRLKGGGRHHLAQEDRLALGVRQFDADHAGTRNDGDAHVHRAHGPRDVVGEVDDARGFGAGRRLEVVEGDDRPRPHLHDLAAHAEVPQHRLQRPGVARQKPLVGLRIGRRRRFGQEVQRGQFVARGRGGGRVGHGDDRGADDGDRRCGIGVRRVGLDLGRVVDHQRHRRPRDRRGGVGRLVLDQRGDDLLAQRRLGPLRPGQEPVGRDHGRPFGLLRGAVDHHGGRGAGVEFQIPFHLAVRPGVLDQLERLGMHRAPEVEFRDADDLVGLGGLEATRGRRHSVVSRQRPYHGWRRTMAPGPRPAQSRRVARGRPPQPRGASGVTWAAGSSR